MAKNTSIFGIMNNKTDLEHAVDRLKTAGFSNNAISALLPDEHGTKDFAHEKNTKAPEGATTGAGTGALLGGTLGWLVGIGMLAIPGIGPFVAAGPIMAALAGAGIGGTIGGVSGALIGMGLPEYEAKRYEGKLHGGGILISVHAVDSSEVKLAQEILEQCNAEDIASASESKPPKDTEKAASKTVNNPARQERFTNNP